MNYLIIKPKYDGEDYLELVPENVIRLALLEDEGILKDNNLVERIGDYVMVSLN